MRNSDGSIGVLKIPEIGLTVTAYDGDTFTAMKKGVGHLAVSYTHLDVYKRQANKCAWQITRGSAFAL